MDDDLPGAMLDDNFIITPWDLVMKTFGSSSVIADINKRPLPK